VRVDVVVPGPEGGWIARSLGDAGFETARPTLAEARGGELLVVALTAADFEPGLRAFREAEPNTPILVVGWDEMDEALSEELGVEGYYPRPVSIARLVRKVQTLLSGQLLEAPPERSQIITASGQSYEDLAHDLGHTGVRDAQRIEEHEAEPRESGARRGERREAQPREARRDESEARDRHGVVPEQHGEQPDDEPGDESRDDPAVTRPPDDEAPAVTLPSPPGDARDFPLPYVRERTLELDTSSGTTSGGITGGLEPTEPAATPPPIEAGVELGAALVDLLRRADRRVFPGEPPLDLRFPGGDESARELVPDELLAEASSPIEAPEADPLEAFTFVGAPPSVEQPSTGSLVVSVTDGDEDSRSQVLPATGDRTSNTVDERRHSPDATASSTVTREGVLAEAGALRMLWSFRDRGRPVRVRFALAGGPTYTLGIDGDVLHELAGDLSLALARALRDEGRIAASAEDEESANALLEAAVSEGRISRFELDGRIRRVRERAIQTLVCAREVRYTVERTRFDGDAPRLFARSLLEVAVEALRRRVSPAEVLRFLGAKPGGELVLRSSFRARAEQAGLEPEVAMAIERAAGGPVGELLHGLPASVGVAGALFALASAEALHVEGGEDAIVDAREVRRRIESLHALSEDADYFRLLGVDAAASAREIDDAYERRVAELEALPLDELGLDELDVLRMETLDVLEDAHYLLSDPQLREVYAQALRRLPRIRPRTT